MKCPFCYNEETVVKDSRTSGSSLSVRRRRYCSNCKVRFSTYEVPHLKELYVIKRSGIKKPFEKSKIYNSIATAMRKRNAEDKQVDRIVNHICGILESGTEVEIPTRKIGDLILTELAGIDEVAYIRFASVYKDFMNVQDFSKFINQLKKKSV